MHKADHLYEGNKIIVPARTDSLNPVPIFKSYINARDTAHGLKPFLWIWEDGMLPTRSWFMTRLR